MVFFEVLEHQAYHHPRTLQFYYFPIFLHRYISRLLQHMHTAIHSWDLLLPTKQQNVCVLVIILNEPPPAGFWMVICFPSIASREFEKFQQP